MKDCLYRSFLHSFNQAASNELVARARSPLYMICHFHISHNAPYLPPSPQILHNLCFSFFLGITAVPREIENNAYAKFWGQIKCIIENVEVAYYPCRLVDAAPTSLFRVSMNKDTGQLRQPCSCVSFIAFLKLFHYLQVSILSSKSEVCNKNLPPQYWWQWAYLPWHPSNAT